MIIQMSELLTYFNAKRMQNKEDEEDRHQQEELFKKNTQTQNNLIESVFFFLFRFICWNYYCNS